MFEKLYWIFADLIELLLEIGALSFIVLVFILGIAIFVFKIKECGSLKNYLFGSEDFQDDEDLEE